MHSAFNTVARHGIGRKILVTIAIVLFVFSISYAETELVKKRDHVQPSQLQTVTGSPNSVAVDSDMTQSLTAQSKDRNDKHMEVAVAWSVNETKTATVHGKRLFTAKGAGSAAVTTANESTKGSTTMTVIAAAQVLQIATIRATEQTGEVDKAQSFAVESEEEADRKRDAGMTLKTGKKVGTVDSEDIFAAKESGKVTGIVKSTSTSGKVSVDVDAPKGWSSITNYRFADTHVRRRIVASATAAISKPSGQSTTNGAWQTDVSGGDGERFRKAIWYWLNRDGIGKALQIYEDWSKSKNPRKPPRKEILTKIDRVFASMPDKHYNTDLTMAKVRDAIIAEYTYDDKIRSADLVTKLMSDALSTYANSKKDVRALIIERIMSIDNRSMPNDDEGTLQYLGIRKHCLEWAMTIAIQAGGKSKNFRHGGTFISESVRPGMGLYCKSASGGEHAMLIIDTKYDNTGKLTHIKVAESNCGRDGCNPWTNPSGQVPWDRVIGTCELPVSNICRGLERSSSPYLVNYDQ
jgi:hypothetical protein